MKTIKIIALACLTATALFSGCAFLQFLEPGVSVEDVQTIEVAPEPDSSVSIVIDQGNLVLASTFEPNIRLVLSNRVQASSIENGRQFISDHLVKMVQTNSGQISLESRFGGIIDKWNIFAVHTTAVVYVPVGIQMTSLGIRLVNGNVTGTSENSIDTVSVSMDNGNIILDRVAASSLTLRSINGNIRAKATELENGQVITDNGNIELTVDSMAVQSVVTVKALNGNLDLNFNALAANAYWKLNVDNGNINARFSYFARNDLKVRARCQNGSVNNSLPFSSMISMDKDFTGWFGNGSSLIEIATINGNVRID